MRAVSGFRTAAALSGMLALPASRAEAQATSASVLAEVQRPISTTKTSDLDFEQVFPGIDKSVAVTSSKAAKFTILAQASSTINLTFALPANITSGGHNLPIASWTARYNSSSTPTGGTDFTPSASITPVTVAAGGEVYLFIGATAQPTYAQASGSYSGTLTLTVVYN